jgi:hypothetical protein
VFLAETNSVSALPPVGINNIRLPTEHLKAESSRFLPFLLVAANKTAMVFFV